MQDLFSIQSVRFNINLATKQFVHQKTKKITYKLIKNEEWKLKGTKVTKYSEVDWCFGLIEVATFSWFEFAFILYFQANPTP